VAAALLGLVPGLDLTKHDNDQRTEKSAARTKPSPRSHRPAPPPGDPTSAKPMDSPMLRAPRGKRGKAPARRAGTGPAARPAAATSAPVAEPQPATPVGVNSTGAAQPAASGAGSGAGTGAAANATPGAPHDKLALRRFGAESIGSSQWFGEAAEPAVGDRPRRRTELRATEQVVESVAILGREHRLAPTVIGDGKAR